MPPESHKPRILCLDDQPETLRVRKFLLEQFGCEVTTVETAEDCLHLATEEKFDLALIDYHLTGETNGEDVARDLAVCVPGMALVMITGDPKLPESACQSVDAVLYKGSSPAEMLDTIGRLLPSHKLRERRAPIIRGVSA